MSSSSSGGSDSGTSDSSGSSGSSINNSSDHGSSSSASSSGDSDNGNSSDSTPTSSKGSGAICDSAVKPSSGASSASKEIVRASGAKRKREADSGEHGDKDRLLLWTPESTELMLERLSQRGAIVHHLSSKSWVAVLRAFSPPRSKAEFEDTWSAHPPEFRKIKMFGREVELPRWQQAYGFDYAYSGSVSDSVPPTPLVARLMGEVNALCFTPHGATARQTPMFNMCLVNWYGPDHYIGPHSDDTRQLVQGAPIAGLSWGHARRFVLSPRSKLPRALGAKRIELVVGDGDLIVMCGDCQETHKHEVPKLKASERASAANRISFTFRCFRDQQVQ